MVLSWPDRLYERGLLWQTGGKVLIFPDWGMLVWQQGRMAGKPTRMRRKGQEMLSTPKVLISLKSLTPVFWATTVHPVLLVFVCSLDMYSLGAGLTQPAWELLCRCPGSAPGAGVGPWLQQYSSVLVFRIYLQSLLRTCVSWEVVWGLEQREGGSTSRDKLG